MLNGGAIALFAAIKASGRSIRYKHRISNGLYPN
jgi:hypothetical protein